MRLVVDPGVREAGTRPAREGNEQVIVGWMTDLVEPSNAGLGSLLSLPIRLLMLAVAVMAVAAAWVTGCTPIADPTGNG